MSTYKILLGGYRESILVTSFEPSTAKFKTLSETKTPNCPSWIEKSLAKGSNVFHCVSESEKTPGLAFSFVLQGDEVKVTEQKETKGIPAHGEWIVFESVRGSTMGVVKPQLRMAGGSGRATTRELPCAGGNTSNSHSSASVSSRYLTEFDRLPLTASQKDVVTTWLTEVSARYEGRIRYCSLKREFGAQSQVE